MSVTIKKWLQFFECFCKPYFGINEVTLLQNLYDLFVHEVYHVMKNFHAGYSYLSYNILKISVILVKSLKHNIFAEFLKKNVTSLPSQVCWQSNYILMLSEFTFLFLWYTNTHLTRSSWLIINKYKTRSIQNGICLVELEI